MHNQALIQLSSVRFGYPGREPLFKTLDFKLGSDERLGLVGPNGSGKTTLLRLLVGLLAPTRGTMTAFGRAVGDKSDLPWLRRQVGFLFQDSIDQLFCPTVREDIAFGPLNLGKPAAEVRKIVARVMRDLGLIHLEDRTSYELSGGERRLVALATVLAMQPRVLLLDEPTTGLDPRSKRELVEQLARIGGTQVIASHDMEFVRSTCRRAVVMDGGRIIADGETDGVLGDDALMYEHGLEVPHSIVAESRMEADHHHGAGPSHGHGHKQEHDHRQHDGGDGGGE